jgi:hypothetical protein
LIYDDDPQVCVNVFVLEPGQPMAMYHWEADQEHTRAFPGASTGSSAKTG